jgi:hypothetical protein
MRTRTKWIVAGGAAALVITPVAAVYGSPTIDGELEQRGLVVDAEAANRARATRLTPTPAATAPADTRAESTAESTAKAAATAKPSPTARASKKSEPSGKKTVSAASPISPKSPKSPDTPG